MGFLTRLLAEEPTKPDRRRDSASGWWYEDLNPSSVMGLSVTPENARTISAVFRAVQLLSLSLAQTPCDIFERIERGRRPRPDHPVHDLLHWQPNPWQTAFDFWEMVVGHVLLRGTFYARLVPGLRGSVDGIIPLHPDRVTPIKGPRGIVNYEYRPPLGKPETIPPYDIFRVTGPSDDGITGLSVPRLARESFGLAMATERYGGALFSQAPAMAGILEYPGALDEETSGAVARSFREAHSGSDQWHGVAVLEKGMTWKQIGMNSEQAQFLATREFSVHEVARWFGIPVHMLYESKTPTFASIEAFQIEFVLYSLGPLAVRIEQAIRRDIIDADRRYYAKFMLGVLMRGDHAARSEFYRKGILDGWLTRNEVRALEDLNPGPPELDRFLEPRNMAEAGTQTPGAVRAQQLAQAAAARLVRKEVAAVTRAAERHAGDQAGFGQAITCFYQTHVATIAELLGIDEELARTYCDQQRTQVSAYGVGALDYWDRLVRWLTRLGLGGDVDDHALHPAA